MAMNFASDYTYSPFTPQVMRRARPAAYVR
jgi:hypothetical protein